MGEPDAGRAADTNGLICFFLVFSGTLGRYHHLRGAR
jgi:hypothetical protein